MLYGFVVVVIVVGHASQRILSCFFFLLYIFFGCWRFTGFHHMSGRICEVRWVWSAPHIKWIPIKCILASFFSFLSFPPTLTVFPPPLSKSFYPPRQKISASPSVSVRGLSYVRAHGEEIRQRVALKGSSVFLASFSAAGDESLFGILDDEEGIPLSLSLVFEQVYKFLRRRTT